MCVWVGGYSGVFFTTPRETQHTNGADESKTQVDSFFFSRLLPARAADPPPVAQTFTQRGRREASTWNTHSMVERPTVAQEVFQSSCVCVAKLYQWFHALQGL